MPLIKHFKGFEVKCCMHARCKRVQWSQAGAYASVGANAPFALERISLIHLDNHVLFFAALPLCLKVEQRFLDGRYRAFKALST